MNAGIGGNRLIGDGAGESALARFDRDVLAVPGVTHVVVFEGINDLGVAFGPATEALAPFRGLFPPSGEVRATPWSPRIDNSSRARTRRD